ncbi:hypothetical protein A2634_00375 [Candidatus Amesbacteria bacterium RIFCSPHIGHO2_01_FULL_48_32]|uniref:DUF1189 domain-containing protein n=1 Tax=Candidatus Amesbacteria bacterium RIFCSPLOWO2_01_FULL_48_25 TaxID=1797259 RepID=A0A1F4ZCX1_9BACT|nr:MAG: hypothetical protein A2634_00375 [Candidatus Amesbacteria bacterium RIFCSPHIGHO2_01_FULL_48_32]OGD03264.1 MAG: hypothetical protein A2989_00325 [Candidatus Amesbacteria bacterium RIFCSPLOWO2_01_FULL_48_25]HJZ05212.1 DUF1189 family protein [Patescibacteria group bacterium]
MLATFRETLTSLQDKYYGKVISTRSLRQVLWYWTKYILLLAVIVIVFGISLITYYVPQLPRLIETNVPQFDIAIKNDQISTTQPTPVTWGNSDFAIILDPSGTEDQLNDFSAGILVLRDRIVSKSQDSSTRIQPLKNVGDFSLSKSDLVFWLSRHSLRAWAIGLSVLIVGALTFSLFFWSLRLSSFSLWAGLFWLISRFTHRPLPYLTFFKLTIYASVLPLLVSAVNSLSPNAFLNYLGLGLFLFYSLSWFWNLTSSKTSPNR